MCFFLSTSWNVDAVSSKRFEGRDFFIYMNHMFHGYDMDRTMLRIGAMNMMTHGVDNPFIEYRDSLSDQNPDRGKYSMSLPAFPAMQVQRKY